MKKRLRIYDRTKINGKQTCTVKSWIQNKCIICGKFLSKKQRRFCEKCGYKKNRKSLRTW